MPKQIGSRQIRGKVGTECFYFRKKMQTGLLRSINQQMSERVKTEINFANTRLYAREFGYAGRIASLSRYCLHFPGGVHSKPDCVNKLTKLYRQLLGGYGVGSFGSRSLYGLEWQNSIVPILNEQNRVDIDTLYPLRYELKHKPSFTDETEDITWTITWDDSLAKSLERNKIDRIWVNLELYAFNTGHFNDETDEYEDINPLGSSFYERIILTLDEIKSDTSRTLTFTVRKALTPIDLPGEAGVGNSMMRRAIVKIDGFRSLGYRYYSGASWYCHKVLDNATLSR